MDPMGTIVLDQNVPWKSTIIQKMVVNLLEDDQPLLNPNGETPSSQPVNIPETSHGLPIPTSLPRDRLLWKKNRGEEPKNSNGSDHLFGRFAWLESRRQQHGRLEGWMDIPGDWMKDIGQTTTKNGKSKGWSSNQQFVDGIFRCYVIYSRTCTLWFLGTRCDLVISIPSSDLEPLKGWQQSILALKSLYQDLLEVGRYLDGTIIMFNDQWLGAWELSEGGGRCGIFASIGPRQHV